MFLVVGALGSLAGGTLLVGLAGIVCWELQQPLCPRALQGAVVSIAAGAPTVGRVNVTSYSSTSSLQVPGGLRLFAWMLKPQWPQNCSRSFIKTGDAKALPQHICSVLVTACAGN